MLSRRTLEQVSVLQGKFSHWRCETQSWLRKAQKHIWSLDPVTMPTKNYNNKRMNKSLDGTVTKLAFSYIYPLSVSPNICKNKFKLWTNSRREEERKLEDDCSDRRKLKMRLIINSQKRSIPFHVPEIQWLIVSTVMCTRSTTGAAILHFWTGSKKFWTSKQRDNRVDCFRLQSHHLKC